MNRFNSNLWPCYASAALSQRIFRNCPMIRHILAPTDLSNESRGVIKYAMHLAQWFQAKLTLLHVYEPPAVAGADSNKPDDGHSSQKWNRAKLSLLSLHDIVRAQYTNTEACLRCGEPGEEVILAARNLPVDLIVASKHDYAWLRRSGDQGDSKRAFRDVACPVLIVQERAIQ